MNKLAYMIISKLCRDSNSVPFAFAQSEIKEDAPKTKTCYQQDDPNRSYSDLQKAR